MADGQGSYGSGTRTQAKDDPYMLVLREILTKLVEVEDKVDDLTESVANLNLETDGFQRVDI